MSARSRLRSPRLFWAGLSLVVMLFVAQGVYMAHRMVTWNDESAYVHFGYLVASGQINLFQDEMTGSRVPLPFWVLGLSQIVFGRSLLAARLVSLGIAVGALVLTALVARRASRIDGNVAGLLAALFVATQGVVVGDFATATYHGLAAVVLLSAFALMWSERQPSGRVIGLAVLSLLFLVRTNLWPILPIVLAAYLVTARSWKERLVDTAAITAVPAIFLLSDPRHLKLMLYVPVLGPLVRRLTSSQPPWNLIVIDLPTTADRVWALVRFGRTYEYWMLALAFLGGIVLLRYLRGQPVRMFFDNRRVNALAALAVAIGICQIVILKDFPRALIGWFASWAPLVAIVLGVGFATALSVRDLGRRHRAALIVVLAVLLLAPIRIVRHTQLPSGAEAGRAPLADLDAAAAHFGRLIRPGAKVFLWGDSLPLYLAGRTPYLQQIHSPFTLAVKEDRAAIEKNGLWGMREMEQWLGGDAGYAVIEPRIMGYFRLRAPAQVGKMEELLAAHFERLEPVTDYPWFPYDVYVRREGR